MTPTQLGRRADHLNRALCEDVHQLFVTGDVPPYTGKWKRSWAIVEAASREWLEGLRMYEAGQLAEDVLGRLGERVLAAWREAGRQAAEAFKKRQKRG